MVIKAWRWAGRAGSPSCLPPEIRRMICATNALESVHARVRKIIKTRGHLPTDDAATTLIWLALRNIMAGWGMLGSRLSGRAGPHSATSRGSARPQAIAPDFKSVSLRTSEAFPAELQAPSTPNFPRCSTAELPVHSTPNFTRLSRRTSSALHSELQGLFTPHFVRVAAVTNPSKSSLNSPVRQKFSGCHCTPMQNWAAGRSMASMMPSGAVAETTKPGAVCLIA